MSNYKDLPPPYSGQPPVHNYYGPPPSNVPPPEHPYNSAYSGHTYGPPQPDTYYGRPPPSNPSYGATTVILTQPDVVVIGGCPACRVGVLEDDFTCAGVLCAILFFPLGILCCLAMREKRCSNCGATFD